jgi:hypothetical protein
LFSGFTKKIMCMSQLSPMHATCLFHFILLDLIMLIIFMEECKVRSCSLCSFLSSSITSCLLYPDAVHSTVFKHPQSFNVRD